MFGRKSGEIVLTKANMYSLNLAQQMIDFIWQGRRMEIVQATLSSREKQSETKSQLYRYEISASVNHGGTLVEVEIWYDLSHRNIQREPARRWVVVNELWLAVRSVSALSGVWIPFDIHAIWEDNPIVVSSAGADDNVRRIWKEFDLDTDCIVRVA